LPQPRSAKTYIRVAVEDFGYKKVFENFKNHKKIIIEKYKNMFSFNKIATGAMALGVAAAAPSDTAGKGTKR